MELIVERGVRRAVDRIDRGPPLVHSEEEWRRRYGRWKARGLLVLFAVLYIPVALGAVLLIGNGEDDKALTVLIIVPVGSLVGGAISWHYARRQPVRGIYEGGIQHPEGIFIPYREVSGIRTGRRSSVIGGKVFVLEPRHPDRDITSVFWNLPVSLYGEDGVEAIKKAVEGGG